MKTFWANHGSRLIFMAIALTLAGLLRWIGLEKEANVIFIGCAMLCYNKARGPMEIQETKKQEKETV